MPNFRSVGTAPLRVPSEHTPTSTPKAQEPVFATFMGILVHLGWVNNTPQVVAERTKRGKKNA